MTEPSDFDRPSPSTRPYLPLPLSKPFFTYILLAAIVIIWVSMEAYGLVTVGTFNGSEDRNILTIFGANNGEKIVQGQTWRLFTSMFLHIGFFHLISNAMGLFVFGFEMESLYGPDRYIIIYILSGLFGSLASFAVRGPQVLSAGASGAIFGIIGMNLAYFFLHRETFGQIGRQRVMSTLVLIGVNLFLGFTVPGIDNLAHLGGLVAGFVLGYGLAPRYRVVDEYTSAPHVIDTVSLLNRWWAPALGVITLAGGVPLAVSFWGG